MVIDPRSVPTLPYIVNTSLNASTQTTDISAFFY